MSDVAETTNAGLSRIELNIPLRAEYVSVIRLTGSGIASRAGFDIDTVEDIKICMSEVCNNLLNDKAKKGSDKETNILIEFLVSIGCLTINFTIAGAEGWAPSIDEDDENVYGLMIARVLMDNFEIRRQDDLEDGLEGGLEGGLIVSMTKRTAEIY